LNAFAKSNFTMTWPAGIDWRYRRAECTAASHYYYYYYMVTQMWTSARGTARGRRATRSVSTTSATTRASAMKATSSTVSPTVPVGQRPTTASASTHAGVFTARCYTCAVYAMALCLSVRPPVRPSQVGVLLKRLNVGSHKQHHPIARESCV